MTTHSNATPTTDEIAAEQRAADAVSVQRALANARSAAHGLLGAAECVSDALQGALAADEAQALNGEMRAALAVIKRDHLIRAANQGWSLKEMAEVLGVSRARVDQIINDR